jgi:hypothetical protein
MKQLLFACLLAGCASQSMRARFRKERFVKLDQELQLNARNELPRIFVNSDEMAIEKAPPYRFIGVLEVEGIQTEELSVFYERVAKAGAAAGCEAMLQRDAFKGVAPSPAQLGLKPSIQTGGGSTGAGGSGLSAGSTGVAAPGAGSTTAGGGGVYHNDLATWQFLCGVGGATQEQAEVTFKKADALAVRMRVAVLGFEPCAPFTPLGSHIRKTRVCADDPHRRNQPDSTAFER